jgi:hypothetical protein
MESRNGKIVDGSGPVDAVEYKASEFDVQLERRRQKTLVAFALIVGVVIGLVSLSHVGRLVERDSEHITLVDVSWVSNTGRRSEFFAGNFDEHCEIEPCPDGVRVELPAAGAVVTDWPHVLPRSVR